MKKSGTFFVGMASGALVQVGAAWGQAAAPSSPPPKLMSLPGATSQFDVGKLVAPDTSAQGAPAQDTGTNRAMRSQRFELRPEPSGPSDKIRLRWQEAPLEGGPRLEIGSFGSRAGEMKHRLLHVALDWAF